MAITVQRRWAWCNKCGCLWFTGAAKSNACAAGGQHNSTNPKSGDYALIHHPTKVELS